MHKLKTIALVAMAIALASCSSDSGGDAPSRVDLLSIQLTPDTWTYISLNNGKTVGTSELGDEAADRLWRDRTDWDIALCNGVIRTNGGTSGRGQGAITSSPQSFESVDPSAVSTLQVDADTVTVWRKGAK